MPHTLFENDSIEEKFLCETVGGLHVETANQLQ